MLAILLLLALIYLFRKLAQYLRSRRRRSAILAQLDLLQKQFKTHQDNRAFTADLAMLLRRAALNRFPRTEVAGLTGNDWLHFLDSTSGHQHFSQGVGKVLADGPYQAHADCDVGDLHRLARAWLQRNL